MPLFQLKDILACICKDTLLPKAHWQIQEILKYTTPIQVTLADAISPYIINYYREQFSIYSSSDA